MVYAGIVFYRGEDAKAVLEGFRAAATSAPDELSMAVNLTTAPPLPFLPEEVHGKPIIAVLGVFSGRAEDGDAATRSFRGLAPAVVDLFSPMPYLAMQGLLDPLYPRGMWNYFRSAFFADLDDATAQALISSYSQAPTRCPNCTSTTSAARWDGFPPTPRPSVPAIGTSFSMWWPGRRVQKASTQSSSGPVRRAPSSVRTRRRT
jgi:hypothetical protein